MVKCLIMLQNNNTNLSALVVKLTPIELLDSAVMRMIGVVNGLYENGYKITILSIPFVGESTHELQECLQKSNVIRLGEGKTTLYNNLGNGNSVKKHIRNVASKLARRIFPFDNSYAYLKYVDIHLLPDIRYDVVISISDPKTSHLAVKKLIKQGLKYDRWIQYWGDPFTYDITSELFYPKFIKKRIELSLFSKADRLVFVSPFTLNMQQKSFRNKAKLMRCCVPPYIKPRIVKKCEHNDKFEVGYFGSYMSVARNIKPLYNACSELSNIHLSIVGNGDVILDSKENISILPRGEVELMEDNCDLLVCILNSSGTQIPGKIYHYAATNKPILIISDGEYGDDIMSFLSVYDRYYFCRNNVNDIIKAINNISNEEKEWEPCPYFESKYVVKMLLESEE